MALGIVAGNDGNFYISNSFGGAVGFDVLKITSDSEGMVTVTVLASLPGVGPGVGGS